MPRAGYRAFYGFTLIEMVVTVAIVALLAATAIPTAELVVKRGKEQELKAALREIRTALDAYKQAADEGRILRRAGESGYPATLTVLTEGVPDLKDPDRKTIRFLRRIPSNPFAEATVPSDKTWGFRSYESSAEDPKPGRDIYDVYPLTDEIALNGIPYKRW